MQAKCMIFKNYASFRTRLAKTVTVNYLKISIMNTDKKNRINKRALNL